MAPISDWLKTATDKVLTTSFQDLVTWQLPSNPTQTDLYYFVFGTASFGRPSGSTQISVTTKIVSAPSTGGGSTLTYGAPQGISMTLAGGSGVVDSQSAMQVVKVPAGSVVINVKLQAKASAAGVSALSSATQGGDKVTTLVGFRTP